MVHRVHCHDRLPAVVAQVAVVVDARQVVSVYLPGAIINSGFPAQLAIAQPAHPGKSRIFQPASRTLFLGNWRLYWGPRQPTM